MLDQARERLLEKLEDVLGTGEGSAVPAQPAPVMNFHGGTVFVGNGKPSSATST